MRKIWWFGDSWIYGNELDDPANQCFATIVSNKLNLQCMNLAEGATSIGYLVHTFFKYRHQINTTDIVLFFLTNKTRAFMNGKNLLPNAWKNTTPNLHPYNDEWYRYFHDDEEEQWMLDRDLMLLHAYCPHAKFCNIYTVNHSDHIPNTAWLMPSDTCIAQIVLPYVHKGIILVDHPALLDTEWKEQQPYVEKYFASGGHPNKLGHEKIAEKILGCLNA